MNDASAPDPCASFPSHDTVNQNTNPWTSEIATDDYSTTVWVYVPSQPLSGWTSFVTIEMGNGTNWNYAEGIAIDATANRQLYIYNNGLFANSQGSTNWGYYTWETTMYYPLNQWFSITVEIHQRPSTQNSWMVLYQNGVEVQRLIDHEANPTPWLPWTFHWGMYVGSGQQTSFQMYNDDISIYNLAGTASSASPTSTAPSRTSTLSLTSLYATPLAVMSLVSLGFRLRHQGQRPDRGRGRAESTPST